ncbi:pyruvate-formate lyase-activating enzyme, partial [Desulfitispora alkaliphila]
TEADVLAISDFIKDQPNVTLELLPYHRLGEQKYKYIGKDYPLTGVKLSNEKYEFLKQVAASRCETPNMSTQK